MSLFPDEEGFELSVILPVQDTTIAVLHDHGDQVMGNVEGQSPEEQVVQKSDFDRRVDKMEEEFLKDRAERREDESRSQFQLYEKEEARDRGFSQR